MLTLYIKEGCPYCRKVLDFAGAAGIPLATKDIYADPAILEELLKRGGKRQVPYLVDEERQKEMYESSEIVRYLEDEYVR